MSDKLPDTFKPSTEYRANEKLYYDENKGRWRRKFLTDTKIVITMEPFFTDRDGKKVKGSSEMIQRRELLGIVSVIKL